MTLTGSNRRLFPWEHLGVDLVALSLSLFLSLVLRVGWEGLNDHRDGLLKLGPVLVSLKLLVFSYCGVYLCLWRYVSVFDVKKLAKAISIAFVLGLMIAILAEPWARLPRSVYFIDWALSLVSTLGFRIFRRIIHETGSSQERITNRRKVLIYGAGFNGRALANRISTDPQMGYELIGFLDDDAETHERWINGHRVLGGNRHLESALTEHQITDFIVAINRPPGQLLRDLTLRLRPFGIRAQIITDFHLNPEEKEQHLYRDIRLEDLLARGRSSLKTDMVGGKLAGKRVLVTGGAGSIGAELVRQILRFGPAELFILDQNELGLFELGQELQKQRFTSPWRMLMGDLQNRNWLASLFDSIRPEVVFHAAAYKHVHLVESNAGSAILNNVAGTRNLLDVCVRYQVADLVNISTDKAVNPVGVMGITKRICELMISATSLEHRKHFSSVRFGNVLGSSGSLIPILQEQIRNGGPVTITHKDMKRYFMLIPEAVSLVLVSSALAKPGDICVLNMGEAVRIVDIAKSLLTLMGRTEEQVPIVFTGVRPGEKLFEELYLCGDEVRTEHPDIFTLPNGDGTAMNDDLGKFWSDMDRLIDLAHHDNLFASQSLKEILERWSKRTAHVLNDVAIQS